MVRDPEVCRQVWVDLGLGYPNPIASISKQFHLADEN